MRATLDGDLRDPRQLMAALIRHRRGVADDEHLGMAGNREIALDDDASRAIERHPERSRDRRCGDARGPEDRPRIEPVAVEVNTVRVDARDPRALAHLD